MRRRLWILVMSVAALSGCGRPELLVLRGNHAFAGGDYGQAIIAYMGAARNRDDDETVAYNLGNVYYALGETGPAVRALERAVDGNGQELRFRSHFNLGGIYYDLGRYDLAVAEYVEALRIKPSDNDAKINLELALKRLQRGTDGRPETGASGEPSQSTRDVLETARQRGRTLWGPGSEEPSDASVNDW